MASRRFKWTAAGSTVAAIGLAVVGYNLIAAQGQGQLAQAAPQGRSTRRQVQCGQALLVALAVVQPRRFVPPAIIVTSETHMAALAAAVTAARAGQEAQVAGVVLGPDGHGGITARGACLPLLPGELQVIAAAVEARAASKAVRDGAQPAP